MNSNPKVVVCGSFRKDIDELQRVLRELDATGCNVVSPLKTEFTTNNNGFAMTKHEELFSTEEIENAHLHAITQSDFVFLFAPNGYVGISASFELGFARALDIPCFAFEKPKDVMLKDRIRQVSSIFEIREFLNI